MARRTGHISASGLGTFGSGARLGFIVVDCKPWCGCVACAYVAISTIYCATPLHLLERSAQLDEMITVERNAGIVSALPGAVLPVLLSVSVLPRLLPIIIQVAVPGPACRASEKEFREAIGGG